VGGCFEGAAEGHRRGNNVTEIDADAKPDAALVGHLRFTVYNPALDLHIAGTASTTLANSAKKPSPVFFTIRPLCSPIFGLTSSPRWALRRFVRPLLIGTHQTRVSGHIGGEDRGEAAD
jgi:hypothetical protein